MTESTHTYSATLLLDVPYETAPGYPETVYSWGFESYATSPSSQAYFQNFETNTLDGWALLSTGKLVNTLWGGSPLSQGQRSLTVGGNSANTLPAFQRVFPSLTVGRSYTVTALATALAPSGSVTTNSNVNVVGGGTSSTFVLSNTATTTVSYTFTATATSHTIRFSTWLGNSGNGDMATYDNITLTANTFVTNDGRGGFSTGTVTTGRKRTGTYGMYANGPARAFSALTIGHQYTLRGWRWDTGVSAWVQDGTTYTAASTSQSFSMPSGAYYWDDVELVHHVPPTMSYELPLSVKAGTVSVNVSRFNHVEASLTVPVTDSSKLANFDPRRVLRVRLDATATFPTFSQSRSYNLAFRSSRPNRATGDVELQLASDESILQDYGPLANDTGPRAYATSIRGLTNYVLSKIGANLQAGAEDADVTPYWSATNLIPDPRLVSEPPLTTYANLGYSAWDTVFPGPQNGVAHRGIHVATPSNSDSYVNVGPTSGMAFSVQEGKTYVFAATGSVRAVITGTGPSEVDAAYGNVMPRQRALVVHATGPGFSPIYHVWHSPQVPNVAETGTSAGTRVSVKFTVPKGATSVFLRAYHGGTGGAITWAMFSLQEVDPAYPVEDGAQYFCGLSPDTANYDHSWRGIADGSPSERRAIVERPRDLFTWRAGVGGVDFLSPILQSQGFRLVCDEERRWTLRRDGYRASGNLSLAHAVNIIGADEEITRDSDEWFDAAVYTYRWRAYDGTERTKDDAFSLVPTRSSPWKWCSSVSFDVVV